MNIREIRSAPSSASQSFLPAPHGISLHTLSHFFLAFNLVTFHLLTPAASAQSHPTPIEVPLTPCPISNPPTSITWLNRPVGDPDLAREHRQALLDAWHVLTQGASSDALYHALENQPEIGAKNAFIWRFNMVETFQAPIDRAVASAKKGRAPFIEPLYGSNQEISLIPPNGAITLAPQLFNWLLVQQEIDGEQAIATYLPLVFGVLEDWLEGEDTYFNLDRFLNNGLLQLAVESHGPNLALALPACPPPYRWTTERFSQRRHLFLFNGQVPQPLLDKISDHSLPDEQVLTDCTSILSDTYQRQLRTGVYLAPTLEEWLKSLQSHPEKNRNVLVSAKRIDQGIADAMHPYRLAILAAISEFDAFSQRHAELLKLPVHESVTCWLKESDPPTEPRRTEHWSHLGEISRNFAYFYAQYHWYSQQSIHAASVIYLLRDHLAHHGTLPASLQLLPSNPSLIDPITNQPFLYQQTSPYQASLELSHHRGGPRLIWNLTAPKP